VKCGRKKERERERERERGARGLRNAPDGKAAKAKGLGNELLGLIYSLYPFACGLGV
jgi:hypothetical protein